MPTSTGAETLSLRSSVPSTRPPSYGRHFHDELLSPPVRTSFNLGGGAHRPRERGSYYVTQMLQLLTSPEPLTLTMDNNLLYPPPPSNALYHLPRNLTWSGNEIFLSRSLPVAATRRATATARDLALYTMRRTPFTHEVALLPRREGLKGAIMRGRRSLFGNMSWEVEVRGDKILKYQKGKWKIPGGKVIAVEKQSNDWGVDEDEYPHIREEITIEGDGVELWMKDLIVAAWCGRIWQANAKISLSRIFMRGQMVFGRCPSPRLFDVRSEGLESGERSLDTVESSFPDQLLSDEELMNRYDDHF